MNTSITESQSTTRTLTLNYEHRLHFTRSIFSAENPLLVEVIAGAEREGVSKVAVVYDQGLLEQFPELVSDIEASVPQLAVAPLGIVGGEQGKNEWSRLEAVWSLIQEAGLCRHSFIVAVGGGALLDLVGFAASTAHRGIPLIRIPTTALSQGDAGVGVKNAVNYFGKKNWLGSFTVPYAVINDSEFLHALPEREKRSGLVEAVKVALIRDAGLFDYIEGHAGALERFEREPFETVIQRSALVHLEHIATGGDPFELGASRPLDFGHWAAHKLEPLSEFALSHGEAVAIGMALDLVYARRSGLLSGEVEGRIAEVCNQLGFPLFSPWLEALDENGGSALIAGLDEFREHLGGRLTIPMVTGIGSRLDVHEMCAERIDASIEELKSRGGH